MQVHRGASPAKSTASAAEQLAALSLSALPTPPPSARTSVSDSDRPDLEQQEEDLNHIFAVGDCAETGAIQAGHTAYWQGEVAVRNILKLIDRDEGKELDKLEDYVISPPAIKLTVGFVSLTEERSPPCDSFRFRS